MQEEVYSERILVMNKMIYLFYIFILCITALLLIGSTYQYVSTKHDNVRYPSLGRLAKVNGRTIHYVCSGKTGPMIYKGPVYYLNPLDAFPNLTNDFIGFII